MKSSRSGERWELSRWLTEAVTLESMDWLASRGNLMDWLALRGYPAVLVALTDQPPFPVAVRGVRQDWRHVVVVPLRGPQLRASSSRLDTYVELRWYGLLLAADTPPRESESDDATVLGRGTTLFEFDLGMMPSKAKQLAINTQFAERNDARAEWSLFDWRTAKWSSGRNENHHAQMSLDYLHATLGIVRARFVVKPGKRPHPQIAVRSFSVQVTGR